MPQFIWRIDDFTEKVRAAKVRLEPWIGSEPFMSDPFGYKMMAFIAPYGFEKSEFGIVSVKFVDVFGNFNLCKLAITETFKVFIKNYFYFLKNGFSAYKNIQKLVKICFF